jgi:itaconate CoA-transferase
VDRPPTLISVEQALSMPYATLRFVHLGWRVIRVEPTPVVGRRSKGDPNRYIGRPVAGEDRHSYYVAPNVGKEAVALDLKDREGREVLRRLVRDLPADVFCTNTLPAHHEELGIDHATLSREREDLVWAAISAMGTAHPDVPGYDPAMQAMCGYMDLTGPRDGPPTQCGPPVIDLKAGDEVFAQVLLAMLERARTGAGKRIDVSMAHAAVSWLHTFLPMLDMGSPPEELRRSGNEHRQFIPVNAYPTRDGFIYMAVGSDAQWARLSAEPMFSTLGQPRYATNEGRRADRRELHASIAEITRRHATAQVAEAFRRATVPHAPIVPIEGVMDLPFVREAGLRTTSPDGRTIRLPPPAVPTPHLAALGGVLPFAPAYGEDTASVLEEIGIGPEETRRLREKGVVA